MTHRTTRCRRSLGALILGAAVLVAGPLAAKDVYKGSLDPNQAHHRAILDTLERLEESPNDASLHNDLACLIAWDGFWRDALREFGVAAKLDKKDARPLFNRGLVQAWRGKWRAARGDFAAARRRDPGNWPAWWMLGYSQEMLGNDRAAVAAYKESLRVDTSLFNVASNPFAAGTRLKARVLLETYDKRIVRAGMPARQEFASPERIGAFFQRSAAPGAPQGAPVAEETVVVPTGPVVTTAPAPSAPSTSQPPPRTYPDRPSRIRRPPRRPQNDPNTEQADPVPPPPDNLPFNEVTPAPTKTPLQPAMGPGGAPPPQEE